MPRQYKSRGSFGAGRAAVAAARTVAAARRFQATAGARAQRRYKARSRNLRTAGYLGIEKKFYDTSLNGGTILAPADAAGGEQNPSATVLLNTVAQGDGESNRDGRKISMDSIQVKGTIQVPTQANATATDVACKVFLALVLDTQTNGANLNSEDVYKNTNANGVTATEVMRNLQYASRFRILKTWSRVLRQPTVVWDGTNIEQGGFHQTFEIYHSLKGMPVTYSGTTSDVANITDNSLHIIAYCSNVGLAPTISYNARLRFRG